MTIFNFLSDLKKRNAALYYFGIINFIALVVFFILYFFDQREILGINPWIKPMKFAISVGIYAWTFGWIMDYIPKATRAIKVITWALILSMFVEVGVIALQSTRGVMSHFNFDTPLDGLLFGAMGIMILVNTAIIFWVFGLLLFKKPDLSPEYLLSIRIAFAIFIFGNIIGGMMIGNGAHSIGGADGGEGIAFFNWSKEHGDLG